MREKRVGKVLRIIEEMGLDGCVLKGMDNIFYLTGFRGSEGTLVVTRDDHLFLLTDFRYTAHARKVTQGVDIVELRDKRNVLGHICAEHAVKRLGFDSVNTQYNVYDRWRGLLTDVELVPLGETVEEIRKSKEPSEVAAIRQAIEIATKAFREVLEDIHPGRKERDIAADLEYVMKRMGADGPSFPTIVASGPRAALPHAEPSDKELRQGETVIIDFGVQVGGYCSDETCTLLLGDPGKEIERVFSLVREAKNRALKNMRVGMAIRELDATVRQHITEAGYGAFFGHGTGHGVGVAVHEAPAVNSSCEGFLEENMVITIEPGIYLPDVGGVRLEDMVLVTNEGPEILTSLGKDLPVTIH